MGWLSRVFGPLGNRKSKYISPGLKDSAEKGNAPRTDADEQSERKRASEDRLRGEGLPLDFTMPPVMPESEIRLRTADEVANRLLALTLVAMKGDGMDHEIMLEIAKERDAEAFFTEDEWSFMLNPEPGEDLMARYRDHFEAVWTLIWALRLVQEAFTTPKEICRKERAISIVRDTPDLTVYGLRRPCRILDKLDLCMRYDWAARKILREGQTPPAGFNPMVAMERYHALRWLTYSEGQENWGELKTAA